MSIYKRGNVYWYDFTVAGSRFRGSTDQTNKELAKDVESALRTEAKQNAGLLPRKAPRLCEFIPNFKTWNEDRETAGKLKPRTTTTAVGNIRCGKTKGHGQDALHRARGAGECLPFALVPHQARARGQ